MSLTKPRTMPGVLELLPFEQIAFQNMLNTIRCNFERYGFLPVETPVMEFSEILLTKSGGETERQVYFVQSSGALGHGQTPELALRFDLTVPLARYVAEHESKLTFPFRRYQIQRVYRGERAQRGRFREFYQCDIDVIGKDALSVRFDAEMPAVIHAVFEALAIGPFTIGLNSRKIMCGYFQSLGIDTGELQSLVLREVDKLDKRGVDDVRSTLASDGFGLSPHTVQRILDFVSIRSSSHDEAMAQLARLPTDEPLLGEGVAEMREMLTRVRDFGVPESRYALNFSIARGLDYYTGTVYETTLDEHPGIGSICSGGRYDNLASHYTRSHLPGVGISIGATRLFWQLREAGLIRASESTVQVLVSQMEEACMPKYLALATQLRAAGINTEVQLEPRKLAKQFHYADRAGIRFVVVLGSDEIATDQVTVKDLRQGDQFQVARSELVRALKVKIEQAHALEGAR